MGIVASVIGAACLLWQVIELPAGKPPVENLSGQVMELQRENEELRKEVIQLRALNADELQGDQSVGIAETQPKP